MARISKTNWSGSIPKSTSWTKPNVPASNWTNATAKSTSWTIPDSTSLSLRLLQNASLRILQNGTDERLLQI